MKPATGIHNLRQAKSVQKQSISRLASKKMGKVMPAQANNGCCSGSIRSLKPTSSMSTTMARLAPAMSWMVNFFNCLIIVRGWHRRASASLP